MPIAGGRARRNRATVGASPGRRPSRLAYGGGVRETTTVIPTPTPLADDGRRRCIAGAAPADGSRGGRGARVGVIAPLDPAERFLD